MAKRGRAASTVAEACGGVAQVEATREELAGGVMASAPWALLRQTCAVANVTGLELAIIPAVTTLVGVVLWTVGNA